MKIEKLSEKDVQFRIETLPEETEVRYYFCTGEPDLDREDERKILARLARGDIWAWCVVKVVATWNGLEGEDQLGCCSYESEKDFQAPDGYWPQMKEEALNRLNEKLEAKYQAIKPLLRP